MADGVHLSPTYLIYSPDPQAIVCPYCRNRVITYVVNIPSVHTYIVSCLLCIIFCPLYWLPFVCASTQTRNHFCPICRSFLGSYP
ncbi:unnamed protein product [Psylliodes chrysocephalus]|uniref:LITAF domain-containing protein n=1 Tax=Psylliodes chrysocephalus TaxID=3402493 RepID=A0A9P0GDI5_9CUCU|nr:unnamed protein product [Psylliodes chrysocephala]